MKLLFITEARFLQTPNGKIYAAEFSFSNILWERYMEHFSEIYVVGRIFEVASFNNENHLVSNVTVLPIVPFSSASFFLLNKFKIQRSINKYFDTYQPQAVIIRGAGSLGYLAVKYCIHKKINYGIEVVGDPYDVYAPRVIKHPLRAIFRRLFTYYQKKAVYGASSVIYVTERKLQERYPANKNAFQTYASDVIIKEIVETTKIFESKTNLKIISVGSLEQMYKGPDVILKAIKKLIDKKINVSLTWLGHGLYLKDMVQLSKELEINEFVNFKGSVDATTLVQYLDESDVFVLASRTEGLPRAVVEAMARALPCIGTNVGGIPELVNCELLIDSEDSSQLADKIEQLINDEDFYKSMSKFSLDIAFNFQENILNKRKRSFFKSLQ